MQRVWYRKAKRAWYATLAESGRQRQIRLVAAPNDRDGRKLAESRLVTELDAAGHVPEGVTAPVGHLVAEFLEFSRGAHKPETAAWYGDLLRGFVTKWGMLRYTQLRKKHVTSWLAFRSE